MLGALFVCDATYSPFHWGPQRKPNAVFAMGRASTSEYSLLKRSFGTCIEDSARDR